MTQEQRNQLLAEFAMAALACNSDLVYSTRERAANAFAIADAMMLEYERRTKYAK